MKILSTLLVIGLMSTSSYAQWTQIGSDIDGEAAGDNSGISVSMSGDGSTLAVGATLNDGNGSNSGHVRVYKLISGTWTQQGADIDGEAAGDQSGMSVSMSADGLTIAIGAHVNAGIGANAGHVRVYKLVSGTWTQQGADIDGEAAGDQSGLSVSMSDDGSTIAIGAYQNDGNGSNSGQVRVYKLISGTWTQQGADIDGEAAGDQSGYSVSLSADGLTVAIGAPVNGGNGTLAGHVRVYKLISGTWTQQGADIDGEAARDQSGWSTSMSADGLTIAVGADANDGNGSNSGHVRVYKLISGTWTQQGADIDGEAADDLSGKSVSISADGLTVAIGAPANGGNGMWSGHVRVYKLISGAWTQQGVDIDGEAAGDYSGPVSISDDGLTVAIGARFNAGNGINSGHARVYSFCPFYGTDTQTACGSYTWIDGNTYTTSNNTAEYTVTNLNGCDSVITLNLTITTIDTTVTIGTNMITANASGASYQWLDCKNNYTVIQGETNQSFSVTSNGEYAVVVSKDGCTDTSACVVMNTVGIATNDLFNSVSISPNPSNGLVNVNLGDLRGASIKVMSINGQLIYNEENISGNAHQFELKGRGVYVVELSAQGMKRQYKLVNK